MEDYTSDPNYVVYECVQCLWQGTVEDLEDGHCPNCYSEHLEIN